MEGFAAMVIEFFCCRTRYEIGAVGGGGDGGSGVVVVVVEEDGSQKRGRMREK